MTIRICMDGFAIEVDTGDELRIAMDVIQSLPAKPAPDIPEFDTSPSSPPLAHIDRVLEFIKSLPDTGVKLLTKIWESTDGLSDSELVRLMGFSGNQGLAGAMSGISKNAKKAGLEYDDILTRTVNRGDGGVPVYHYQLTGAVIEIMDLRYEKPKRGFVEIDLSLEETPF